MLRAQSGDGLWSRDTNFGRNGYQHEAGYDQAETSFHILTTGGIKGRDILAKEGGAARRPSYAG